MNDPKLVLQKISTLEPSKQVVDELVTLVQELIKEVQMLRQENQELKQENKLLRDEVARLKNQKPRPKIEPSKLEKKSPKSDGQSKTSNWSKGSKNQNLIIDNEEKIEIPANEIPEKAVFKGYKEFVVQELITTKKITRYLLAQWQKQDGTYISANLPKEVGNSHFGLNLQQHIIYQYHANRVPQNRIASELRDKGISISEGKIDNILRDAGRKFQEEKEQILPMGLKSSYVQTDDTGSRHRGKNGFATVICGKLFAYFKSHESKSRINFLEILCGDKVEYTITDATLDYIMGYKVAPSTLKIIKDHLGSSFADGEAWNGFMKKHLLGKTTERILTEGTLIGTLMERETITKDTMLLSDGAGQFSLFNHALCWIHIERSIKKLIPLNEQDRVERDSVLSNLWDFYKDLKAYKSSTPEEQVVLKKVLSDRFDTIFSFYATEMPLANVLKKIRDQKSQLMLVLENPTLPLHNNASESDIREYVTKRKISGGTRSQDGRNARDTFVSLLKTCKKLSISFWDYLADRIHGLGIVEPLPSLISKKIRFSTA